MKNNKHAFRIKLDIFIFLITSIICILSMIFGIINNSHIIKPSILFVLIYLIKLIFYKICIEMNIINYNHALLDLFMSIICFICLTSTIMLIIYLIIFSLQELLGKSLKDILSNHVLYATLVGSWFILHLACDNMSTFYNLYLKDNKSIEEG